MWFSTAEIATALGISVRTVNKRGRDWDSRPRRGQGGGKEYHFDSLPTEAQAALLKAQIAGSPENSLASDQEISAIAETHDDFGATAPKAAGIERATSMSPAVSSSSTQAPETPGEAGGLAIIERVETPLERPADKDQARIHAKLEILRAHQAHCLGRGIGAVDCEYEFCDLYNQGRIDIAPWVRGVVTRLGRSTLRRWQASAKKGDLLGVGDGRQGRPGTMIDSQPLIRQYILGQIAASPNKINAHYIYRGLHLEFPAYDLPSLPTLRRWIERWQAENPGLYERLRSPDSWKNRNMPAFGSYSEGIERVNQLWELDSTPADVALLDGGKVRRYHLVGCIDVFSRRGVIFVVPTSRAAAIALLVRECILAWGIPEKVKTDNGSDYKSIYLQQIFASLGVEQHFCKPYSPEQKPHIERFLGTFSHGLAAYLPGYLGHDVAARQAIRSQQEFADLLGTRGELLEVPMEAAEFHEFVVLWCNDYYPNQHHEGIGTTPALKAEGAKVRRVRDIRALDLLLAEGREASVQKKGIRIDGRDYIAAELGDRVRERVHIRYTEDAGRIAVFADRRCTQFVCIAECPDLVGSNRQAIAMAAKRVASAQKAAVRDLKQAGKSLGLKDLPHRLIEAARDQAEISAIAEISTDAALAPGAVEAIAALTDGGRMAEPITPTLEDRQLFAVAEAETQERVERAALETPENRFYRIWKYREQGIGAEPPEADMQWYARVGATSSGEGLLLYAESCWGLDAPPATSAAG